MVAPVTLIPVSLSFLLVYSDLYEPPGPQCILSSLQAQNSDEQNTQLSDGIALLCSVSAQSFRAGASPPGCLLSGPCSNKDRSFGIEIVTVLSLTLAVLLPSQA